MSCNIVLTAFVFGTIVCATLAQRPLPGEPCLPIDPARFCADDSFSECIRDEYNDLTCLCITGYALILPDKICLKIPSQPGDRCHDILANCENVPLTSCLNSVCECNSGFQYDSVKRRCLRSPERPGDICQPVSVPCSTTSTPPISCGQFRPDLGENVCECLDDLVTDVVNHRCLTPPRRPGDSCTADLTPCNTVVDADTTCTSDGMGNYFCNCNGNLVLNPVLQICLLPPTRPGQECDPDYTPCINVENTTCQPNAPGSNSVCTCAAGLVTDFVNELCLTPPILPGDHCDLVLTPCDTIPNTECVNSACQCGSDYVEIPNFDECLLIPLRPGQKCHPIITPCNSVSDTQCIIESGDFRCMCNYPLITDINGEKCLSPPGSAGDLCEPRLAPCSNVERTTCARNLISNEYICTCLDEFVFYANNRSCLFTANLPGDPCDPILLPCNNVPDATTCAPNPSGNGHYCKCNGDLVNDPNRQRCLRQPQHPRDTCHPVLLPCTAIANTQCIFDLVEDEFRCHCNTGQVYDAIGRRCISKPIRPQDPCEPVEADCSRVVNTTCFFDITLGYECRCLGDLVTENKRCLERPRLPGDECSPTQADCTPVENTNCVFDTQKNINFCKCHTTNFFTDLTRRMCVPLPMKAGDACHPADAFCTSIEHSTCQPQSPNDPNGPSHVCKCLSGYYQSGTYSCIPLPRNPLDACGTEQHCENIFGTNCLGLSCQCIPDQFDLSLDQSKCIKKSDSLLGECETYVQCSKLNNTDCIHSKCDCVLNTYPSQGLKYCLHLVRTLGAKCFETFQCQDGIGVNAFCNVDVCSCTPGSVPYHPDPDISQCLKISGPGEGCTISDQCQPILGQHSECDPISSICKCKSEASFHENKCYTPSRLHAACDATIECVLGSNDFAICDSITRTCKCAATSVEHGGVCKSAPKLGEVCYTDQECQISITGIALCDSNLCKCSPGSVPHQNLLQCLRISGPGESCIISGQCQPTLGQHSECDPLTSTCKCKSGAELHENKCYTPSRLHATCDATIQCILGSNEFATCDSITQTCKCVATSVEQGGVCKSAPKLGEACTTDQECQIAITGLTICHYQQQTCQCGMGYKVANFTNNVCTSGSAKIIEHSFKLISAAILVSISVNFF